MSGKTVQSRLTFDISSLQRFISLTFPQANDEASRASIDDGRSEGLTISKMVVHKDTWSLYNSGRKIPTRKQGFKWTGGFSFGGYITNPKSGRKVDYALYHEEYLKATEGRGYIEAGVDEMAKVVPTRYRRYIREFLNKYRRPV